MAELAPNLPSTSPVHKAKNNPSSICFSKLFKFATGSHTGEGWEDSWQNLYNRATSSLKDFPFANEVPCSVLKLMTL